MDSDDKMLAISACAFCGMMAVMMISGAWYQVEKQRTERAAIERGCPTPTAPPKEQDRG